MIIAVDIGNTNIVIGLIDGRKILFSERIVSDIKKTELEYASCIKAFFDLYGINIPMLSGGIISSVVPPLKQTLRRCLERFFNISPIIVEPGIRTGMRIMIDNPQALGADLIVDAVAGREYYGSPLIMIDMGTATTITAIDGNSDYIGGVIIPGVIVSLEALVDKTSQLPRIALESPRRVIGKNTVECMKSGVIYSQAGAIDGIIDRMREEMKSDAAVVATGGLAESIIRHCRNKISLDRELTLKGLGILYEKNS